MRIKTITCHDVYNVGASLQAYALVTYLKRMGHDVEIIDYKPDYLSKHYSLISIDNPLYDKPILRQVYLLLKLPGRIRARKSGRKQAFDSFREKYLPVTPVRYTSNEELKENPPDAEIYFAGSDQIWNTTFKNGKDPAFYLDFVPENRVKASYAASFATEQIDSEWEEQIAEWLSDFDHVSVRESSGVKLAERLGVEHPEQVLDPVFLLPAGDWEKIEKKLMVDEPYILVYDFDENNQIKEFAQKKARENGWKIYTMFHSDYSDRIFYDEGPEGFVALIHHAEYVISNSFHATAFSIIFNRPFAVFDREECINTRMRDLTQMFELESVNDRINIAKTEEILREHLCYSTRYIEDVVKREEKRMK